MTFVPTAGVGLLTVLATATSATPAGTRTVAVDVLLPGVGSFVVEETVVTFTMDVGAG